MKKTKKSKRPDVEKIQNPVAKFAFQFNKAQTFKDKTKYQRQAKHKGQEPFAIQLFLDFIAKGFSLNTTEFTANPNIIVRNTRLCQ